MDQAGFKRSQAGVELSRYGGEAPIASAPAYDPSEPIFDPSSFSTRIYDSPPPSAPPSTSYFPLTARLLPFDPPPPLHIVLTRASSEPVTSHRLAPPLHRSSTLSGPRPQPNPAASSSEPKSRRTEAVSISASSLPRPPPLLRRQTTYTRHPPRLPLSSPPFSSPRLPSSSSSDDALQGSTSTLNMTFPAPTRPVLALSPSPPSAHSYRYSTPPTTASPAALSPHPVIPPLQITSPHAPPSPCSSQGWRDTITGNGGSRTERPRSVGEGMASSFSTASMGWAGPATAPVSVGWEGPARSVSGMGRGGGQGVGYGAGGEGGRRHSHAGSPQTADGSAAGGNGTAGKSAAAVQREKELQEAMRASRAEAELFFVHSESKRLEEERLLAITIAASSYSAEQEHLRALRLAEEAEAEEAALVRALEQSQRDKGKGRQDESGEERREREEMEMVMALSLSEVRLRIGRGQTSAERFAELSRPEVEEERYDVEETVEQEMGWTTGVATPTISVHSYAQDGFEVEIDDSLPPPAYEFDYDYPSPASPNLEDYPRVTILGPGRPLLDDMPIASTSAARDEERVTILPPTPSPRLESPESPIIGKGKGVQRTPSPVVSEQDLEDPFADEFAAADYDPRDFETEENQDPYPSSSASASPGPSTSLHLALPLPPASFTPLRQASPLYGGLVDNTSTNALADLSITTGIKFGFVKPAPLSIHPVLEHEGAFPDVAQMSRRGGEEGNSMEYGSFALEASGWRQLLSYLMWHGNSRIEAAPRDIQHEKSTAGLRISLTLQFFLSFTTSLPRIRLLLTLLAPLSPYTPTPPSPIFDDSCPNITISLPTPLILPLSLSSLAMTLSATHKLSQTPLHTFSPLSPSQKLLLHLPSALSLFSRLSNDPMETALEEEESEDGLLRRLKGRLKRRKRNAGIVKGGVGEGGEEGVEGDGRALPEGAGFITPFTLEG